MRHTRQRIRLASAAALSATALALAGTPAASAATCGSGSASAMPGEISKAAMSSATVCLLNAERTQRGLRPLKLDRRLSRAAAGHAGEMVRREYFSHESLSGASFVDRIRRTGYLSGPRAWFVGENLAWGSGDRSSPAAIVRAWMHSPGHRANILQRRFRQIGLGLVMGAPVQVDGPAATYATEFGTRS
jgi:uncharacterized protein YkwD